MSGNVFEVESFDYYRTKGDSIQLKFRFKDSNGAPIDITSWGSKFTLFDPVTHLPLTAFQKTHNDNLVGGNGIAYNNDSAAGLPDGMGIEANEQLVVYFPYTETAQLDKEIYPFDLEFTVAAGVAKMTPVHGNLILKDEVTASV